MKLKNKSVLKAVAIAALATVAFTGCTQQGSMNVDKNAGKYTPGEKLKIAFAYTGVVGDAGWTFAHDEARRNIEKSFGEKIETSFVENVDQNVDATKVLTSMAQNGNHLIFGTISGYGPAIKSLSTSFPNVKFENAAGKNPGGNISVYDAKTFEGAYLSGIIAGSTTKSNTLGYVASLPVPEVYRNINSFTLGVRSVNPNAVVKVSWVGDWFHAEKEREASLQLINQGADVLFQNTNSSSPLRVAEEKGIRAFGWDSDMSAYGPRAHLGSSIINWTPYYEKTVQDAIDGKWTAKSSWNGVREGVVDVVSLAKDISPAGLTAFNEAKEKLVAGSMEVWAGPIKKNTGEEFLPAGKNATVEQLLNVNFFVEGVDVNSPTK